MIAEGSPLATRRAGVDYTVGAVNVNACNVSVPEVAINTSQEQNGQAIVLNACHVSVPEVAINTSHEQGGQASMLKACHVSVPEVAINTVKEKDKQAEPSVLKESFEVFPSFYELGGKELIEALMEESEDSVEEGEVVFVKEVPGGELDRPMPVTFEEEMNARNPACLNRVNQVPDKRQIDSCSYMKQLHRKVVVAPKGQDTHLAREGPQDAGPQTPWDKEVAELIAKHLRSKFTYQLVAGKPTVLGVLQGHQVYIHVDNSNHVKHTLQLFQTQIEGSRMYTNTGVIVLPRGKKYVNQLKHMRRLELELPPFMKKWKKAAAAERPL